MGISVSVSADPRRFHLSSGTVNQLFNRVWGVCRLRSSLVLSLITHLILIFVGIVYWQFRPTQAPTKKLTWIELEPSQIKKSAQNQKEEKRLQIVQTDPGEKIDSPLANSFLGWQNQKVDRETVSKNKNVSIGAPSKKETPKSPKTLSKNQVNAPPKPLSQLGLKMFAAKSAPDTDQPDWATPGTRAQDYVNGMKESDRTALNTSEYRFYGYFQRIRERLDRAWIPILREKLVVYYSSGRRLASDMSHTTKIMVVLNGNGEITRVQMVSESGTRDLDEAAIAAFNSAGPFPNPPSGMIDLNGEVKIPWDFILKT